MNGQFTVSAVYDDKTVVGIEMAIGSRQIWIPAVQGNYLDIRVGKFPDGLDGTPYRRETLINFKLIVRRA